MRKEVLGVLCDTTATAATAKEASPHIQSEPIAVAL